MRNILKIFLIVSTFISIPGFAQESPFKEIQRQIQILEKLKKELEELIKRKEEVLKQYNKTLQELKKERMKLLDLTKKLKLERYKKLAKAFEKMEPEQAANLINNMDPELLAYILYNMKPSKAGEILQYADPVKVNGILRKMVSLGLDLSSLKRFICTQDLNITINIENVTK